MHYHNFVQRELIYQKNPDIIDNAESKVMGFINLCIYPYKWELIYDRLRTQERITSETYAATKGVIAGLLVLANRMHREYQISVDAYILDFIALVRSDKQGNPMKFLLNMRMYMPRFLFVVGLRVAFAVDWRQLVFDVLKLRSKPQSKTYHSVFCNPFLRKLLHAYVIWKQFRESHDPDYQAGVNDIKTLVDKYSALSTNKDRGTTEMLLDALLNQLPSWSVATRTKAAWAIDTAQDGYAMVNRQFSDFRYKQVQG